MAQSKRRRTGLIVLGIVIAALIILAASLPQMEFSPGYPLPSRGQSEEAFSAATGFSLSSRFQSFVTVAFMVMVVLFALLIVTLFFVSPQIRKQVLSSLAAIGVLLLLMLLVKERPEVYEPVATTPIAPPPEVTFEQTEAPVFEFDADPPQWAIVGTSIVVALLLATVLVAIGWLVLRRLRQPDSPLEQVAQQAQATIQALKEGADLRDTVARCYHEMGRAVDSARGIRRDTAMTPREFEIRLSSAGLPREPVQDLTRLFEAVRYGAHTAGEDQEQQAMACLAAIVSACQEER